MITLYNTVTTGYCTNGEVRLVGGESEFEGRVEVCFNRRWGTISSDGWTQTNTHVLCNDLGYDLTGRRILNSPLGLACRRSEGCLVCQSIRLIRMSYFLEVVMHACIYSLRVV